MLHVIKSPQSLKLVTALDASQDVILLVEDAIYTAVSDHKLHKILENINVYVLDADVIARGCTTKVSKALKMIGYDGFVGLTEQHSSVITWP
jgi:tRNA 2-thiouridine synthesizing protein B